MIQAIPFDNCFVCNKDSDGFTWYHDRCKPGFKAIAMLDRIPDHIPKKQHFRWIRALYLRKIQNERIE